MMLVMKGQLEQPVCFYNYMVHTSTLKPRLDQIVGGSYLMTLEREK